MVASTTNIEQHPDIAALRMRYDQAAETPTAKASDGLSFLTALFLAVSPWIIGFTALTALTVNNLVTGLAAAALSIGFATAFARMHGVAWVAPLIGVWTIVAPWVVTGGHTTRSIVSNVIAGALLVIFGVITMGLGMRRSSR